MTDTTTTVRDTASDTATDAARAEALVTRLLEAYTLGSELLTVDLGRRLGLYAHLAVGGPTTAAALACDVNVAVDYGIVVRRAFTLELADERHVAGRGQGVEHRTRRERWCRLGVHNGRHPGDVEVLRRDQRLTSASAVMCPIRVS